MAYQVTLLVNPVAGKGRGVSAGRIAARALREQGVTVTVAKAPGPEQALADARQAVADGTDALVAVGGDGITSLALQAVAGTGVPLGVVAVGTGNDFARAHRLPIRDEAAAVRTITDAIEAGQTTGTDLGRIGDRWFGTILAVGFDSRVNDRANRMRWPHGRMRYDLAILAELASLRPIRFTLGIDGAPPTELDATLIAVGNSASYGGGVPICAGAKVDDGLFDIVIVAPLSRTRLVRLLPRAYKGTHLELPVVTVHRAATVTLAAAGVNGYADGELVGALPLTAECVPGAVTVLGS